MENSTSLAGDCGRLVGVIALRIDGGVMETVRAQTPQFDHVTIVAPLFLHKGEQGLLLLDMSRAEQK